MPRKVHYSTTTTSLCGRSSDPFRLTDEHKKVTCKFCVAEMKRLDAAARSARK